MADGSSAHGGFTRFAGFAYVSLNSDMQRRLEFFQGGDDPSRSHRLSPPSVIRGLLCPRQTGDGDQPWPAAPCIRALTLDFVKIGQGVL